MDQISAGKAVLILNMEKYTQMNEEEIEEITATIPIHEYSKGNTAQRLYTRTAAFPPSRACKILDVALLRLQILQAQSDKNSSRQRAQPLCGIAQRIGPIDLFA